MRERRHRGGEGEWSESEIIELRPKRIWDRRYYGQEILWDKK
jgi:hypothetical protein